MGDSTPTWVRWLPLTAGVLWGTAFPATEIALRTFSPFDIAFGRAFVGTVSLGIWLLIRGDFVWRFSRTTWLRLFVLALAGSGLFWPAHATAVRLSTPVNAAFLISIYPVFIAIVAPFILGEDVRRRHLGALAIALIGAYLIISGGRVLDLFASDTLPGDLLALTGALLFTFYLTFGRRWRDAGMSVSSQTLSLYTFTLATPVLAIFAGADGSMPAPPTLVSVGAIVWLGLMTTTVAFIAINTGMSAGAVSRSSVHLLIIPLVAAVLSWVMFGTTLTPPQWIGGALVLAGIAMASR